MRTAATWSASSGHSSSSARRWPLLAIAQRLGGVFQWRGILIQSDGYSYRSNATFSDPNNLARYFALTMSLAVGLILATGPRRTTLYLAVPALALASLGIVATASRSGWAMVILCTAIVVLTAPIARYTKAKLAIVSVGALALMIALLLVQGGQNADRVRTLADPVTALGQRDFLIRVGWQMFLDNPLIGVGSGNYQHALIVSYRYLIPAWAEVTLSHTSIISIIAENGIIGLAVFLFVCVRLAAVSAHAYFATKSRYNRLIIGWLGAGLLGIVLHSQSEGRLFDEPYIYLLMAMLVALETAPALRGATTEAPPAVEPEAVPVAIRAAAQRPSLREAPVAPIVDAG